MKKEDSKQKSPGFSNNIIGDNFSHNHIIIGTNNDNNRPQEKKSIVKEILIGVLITVIGGVIIIFISTAFK